MSVFDSMFGNIGDVVSLPSNSLTWLLTGFSIFLGTIIVSVCFYHFILRKKRFNIQVEIKRLINQDGKSYLIDDRNDWAMVTKDKTRLILLKQGSFMGYLNKIKFSAPPSDYIRPTLFGTKKVTMVFNGHNEFEYTYTKNNIQGVEDIHIQAAEIDTIGVIFKDMEHEAQKRRLSAPYEKLAVISAFVVITVFFVIGMVFIVMQNKDISKSSASLAGSCNSMEQVCTKYMQLSDEICDKRCELIYGGGRSG
jgi:hypothetical protein